MTLHLPALSGIVLTYLLVFSRVGAMVMLLPAIGEAGVPSLVRLVLALSISVALTLEAGAVRVVINPLSSRLRTCSKPSARFVGRQSAATGAMFQQASRIRP